MRPSSRVAAALISDADKNSFGNPNSLKKKQQTTGQKFSFDVSHDDELRV
jgi:hypothetical protein